MGYERLDIYYARLMKIWNVNKGKLITTSQMHTVKQKMFLSLQIFSALRC